MKPTITWLCLLLATTLSFSQTTFKEMDSLVKANHYKKISSIVISHKGNIIFENYYNEATEKTLHNTRSATKTITSTLIGNLLKDGEIKDIQTPVWQYSKAENIQYPDTRKEQITIESLLTMSSILECNDWNGLSRGNEEKMYLLEDWVQFYWDLPIKGYPEWQPKPETQPYGRDFSYCTAGTVVLGDVIQNITGSLEKYAEKALFSKLGMTEYHWQITPTGTPMTGGGLGIRSRDFIKIGQLYLNDGIWEGEQIISTDFVRESTTPKATMGDIPYEYGYLWWIGDFGSEKKETGYFMSGSGGNKIAVFDELDLVVVLTSSLFTRGMESHNQTTELLDKFIIPSIQKL